MVTSVEFLSTAAPSGVDTIDVSADKDGSILAWVDGTTFKVAPKENGHIIYANPDSSLMFRSSYYDDPDYYYLYINTINFENFNTSKVTDMGGMFSNCRKLTVLDLSSFDTSNVTNMNYMFATCDYLKTIFVSNAWTVENVENSESMFYNCYDIVGQSGKTHSVTKLDKAMANYETGYLTLK